MYGFNNNYNPNYNMYYNQQHQIYQQHSFDYIPEGSMQPNHHQQYHMYNPGFMPNPLSMPHNNYNMMQNPYGQYDNNMQYNKVEGQQEFSNPQSVNNNNQPPEQESG
jgi:hypothetical protein